MMKMGMKIGAMMGMKCFRSSDWEEQVVESVSWPAPAMLEMWQGKCRLKDFW